MAKTLLVDNNMNDNELIVYALTFLLVNVNDMVEEDLDMSENAIEARLREIIKKLNKDN